VYTRDRTRTHTREEGNRTLLLEGEVKFPPPLYLVAYWHNVSSPQGTEPVDLGV
jgi:hypothetical protein